MHKLNMVNWETRRAPAPNDLVGWKLLRAAQVAAQTGPGEQVAAREQVSLKDMTLGGVQVLEIRPKAMKNARGVIVYVHGGAYTMSSARGRTGDNRNGANRANSSRAMLRMQSRVFFDSFL